jgi:uncharacterized protein
MDITPLVKEGTNIISSYSKDYVVIQESKYEKPIIITKDIIHKYNDLEDAKNYILNNLNKDNLIILLGVDKVNYLEYDVLISEFSKFNISVELLNYGAAVRTYNILALEERNVLAWFI